MGTIIDSNLQSEDRQIYDAIPQLGFERGIKEIMKIVEESKGVNLDYTVIIPDSTIYEIYGKQNIQIEDIKVDNEIISEFIHRYKAGEIVIVPWCFTAKIAKYIPYSIFLHFSNTFFSLEPAKEGGLFRGYTEIIVGGIIVVLISIGIRIYQVRKKKLDIGIEKTRERKEIGEKIEKPGVEKTLEEKTKHKAVSASSFRYCPYCGSKLRPEDVFCSNCGKKQVKKQKKRKKQEKKKKRSPR
jgi:hypothetical protein